MAVINNAAPAPVQTSDNGMGFLIGVLLLIFFFVFLVYYGLPAIRSSFSGPQISVPDKVDINVHQNK